jgi:hypothetical protein
VCFVCSVACSLARSIDRFLRVYKNEMSSFVVTIFVVATVADFFLFSCAPVLSFHSRF